MRKRLVQQRFERVGCPTAINGLHRSFQGPIQAREGTLGDLLAEQGFDRAARVAVMAPSDAFACSGEAPTARLPFFKFLRPMGILPAERLLLWHQHRDHLVAVAAVDEEIIVQGENDGVFMKFGQAHEADVGE